MSLTRQLIVEQREKSKYVNQNGLSREELNKKEAQLEKELKRQMKVLEQIQNSNIDESGVRLDDRQNVTIIRKRHIEKHRNKYVKEAIQYKTQAQVSIEQQLARQKKEMIEANLKSLDQSLKKQILQKSNSNPQNFNHYNSNQNIVLNQDENSIKSLESIKNYNNQSPQIFQINVSTTNNKNEQNQIPIGLMRTERVSETYMSHENGVSKQQNKFLQNNIDLLNTHQVATSTKKPVGVTQSVNQESFGFSGTTTSFKMEMSEIHTLARAGNIYKDNDQKQNAAHLDYMKLIKQGNSRKTIQGESQVNNQKNKNADLTEFNNQRQRSQNKFSPTNQVFKQQASNNATSNGAKFKQQTLFQQQIINVIDQKLNFDAQFQQYINQEASRANKAFMYPIDQKIQQSHQNQSKLIDNSIIKSSEAYNVNDIMTAFNIPLNMNDEVQEHLPFQEFSKINQNFEAKKNFNEFKKFVISSPQTNNLKSLKKLKNDGTLKLNNDMQNGILQGNQQYSNSSSQEFVTDQNGNPIQNQQATLQQKEEFLQSMFDQQNSRNANDLIVLQKIQSSQIHHPLSSKSLKYKDEYIQSNEYSNGIGHDLLQNQIQSNRESKEQLVIAVMDSLSRNDSQSKENSFSHIQKPSIQINNNDMSKIQNSKDDMKKLNVVGTGQMSPTKNHLNQDLETAIASPNVSPTNINNYNKKLQLLKQNIETKNIKLIDQVVGKNYQYNIQNIKEINKNYQLQVRLNQNLSPQKLIQIPMFGQNFSYRQNKGDIIVEENESPLYKINIQKQGLNQEKKGLNSPFYKSGLVNVGQDNQFYKHINTSGYRSYNQEIGNASDITNIKQPKYEGLSSEMLNNAVESIQKKSGFTNKTFIQMDSRLKGQKGLVIKRHRVSNLSEIKDQDQKDELGGYTGEDGITMKNEDNIEQTSINFNKLSSLEGPGRETIMGGAAVLGTSFVRTKSQLNEKNFQNISKNKSSEKKREDKDILNQNLKQNNASMLSNFKPNKSSPKSSFQRRAGSQLAYYETIQEESIDRDTSIAVRQINLKKQTNLNVSDLKNQIKIEHNENPKEEIKMQKKDDGNVSNKNAKSPRNQKIFQKVLKQQDYDFQQMSKAVGANIEKPQLNTTIYNISPIEVYIENKSATQQNKSILSPQKSLTQRPKYMLQKQIFQKIKEQIFSPQQTNTKGFQEQPLQINNVPELKKTVDFANLNSGNMNNPYLSYYIGHKNQNLKKNVPSISQALIQKNMELNINNLQNNGQNNSIKNTIKRSISPVPTSQDNRGSPKSNNSQKNIISINEKERGSISIGLDLGSRKALSNLNMQPIYKGKDKQVRETIEEHTKVNMQSQNVQIKLQELQELQELNELFEQTVNDEMSEQNKNINDSILNQDQSQINSNDVFKQKNFKIYQPMTLHEAQNSKEVEKMLQFLLKDKKIQNTEEILMQIGKLKSQNLIKLNKFQSPIKNIQDAKINSQIQSFQNNKQIQIKDLIQNKKKSPLNFISQEDLYELQYILSQSPDFLVQNYDREIQDYLMEAYNEQKKYEIQGKIKDNDLFLRKKDLKVKRNYEELYYSARASNLQQQYLQMIQQKIFDNKDGNKNIEKNLKPKFQLSQKQDGKDIKVQIFNKKISDLEFIKNNVNLQKNLDSYQPSRLEQILEKLKIVINSEGDQSYEVENAIEAETNAKIDDDNQIQGRLKELMEKCLYFTASQKKKQSMALGDDAKRIGSANQSLARGWEAWDTETESIANNSIIVSQRKKLDKESDKWFESNPIFTKDVVNPENDEVLQMIKERYLGLDEEHDRRWKNKYTFLETNNLQDIYQKDFDTKSNQKQNSIQRQNSKDIFSLNNDKFDLPRNKLILKNQSKQSLSPSSIFPGGVSDMDIQMRHRIQDTIVLNKKYSKATISPQMNRNISSKTIQSIITLQDTEIMRKKAIERQHMIHLLKKEKQQQSEMKIEKKEQKKYDQQFYGNILQDSSFVLPSIYDDKIAKIANPDQEILPQRKRNLSVQSVQLKNPFSQEQSSALQLNQQNLRKLDQILQSNQNKKFKTAQKAQNQSRQEKNLFGQIDFIKNLNTTQLIDEFKEKINGPDCNQISTQLYYRKDLTYLDKMLPEIKVPFYQKFNLLSPLSQQKNLELNQTIDERKSIQQNFGINNISEKEYFDSFKRPLIYKYQLRQPKYQLTGYAKYLEEQENQKLMKQIDKVKNQETMQQLKKMFDKIL